MNKTASARPIFSWCSCLIIVACWAVSVAAQDGAAKKPALRALTIFTEVPGLAPAEIESLVSQPIESTMAGLAEVVAVRSASSAGRSTVWMDYRPGADLLAKRQAVTERLQLVQSRLPLGARVRLAPLVAREGDATFVAVTDDTLDGVALRALAELRVRPRLLTIPGVADVAMHGGRQPVCEIVVDHDRLGALDVPMQELIAAVSKVSAASDSSDSKPTKKGPVVGTIAKGVTADDIGDTVVSTRDGRPVRVKDVASVRFGGSEAQGTAAVWTMREGKASRHAGILLAVQRGPGTKSTDLAAAIGRVIERAQADLPASVRVSAETFGRGDVSVVLRGPADASLEDWRRAVQQAEARVAEVRGVQGVLSATGSLDDQGLDEPSGAAQMFVRAVPGKHEEVAAAIRLALGELPSVAVSVAPAAEPRGRFLLKVLGPDLDKLRSLAEQARTRLATIRGVADLHVDRSDAGPQLQIDIDRERAAKLGIAVRDVVEVAQAAWQGRMVGHVTHEAERRELWVKFDERLRVPEVIGRTLLAAAKGERVPLSSLVEIKHTTGPRVIYRENGKRRVAVAFRTQGRKPSEAIAAAKRELAGIELPQGYTLVWDVPAE